MRGAAGAQDGSGTCGFDINGGVELGVHGKTTRRLGGRLYRRRWSPGWLRREEDEGALTCGPGLAEREERGTRGRCCSWIGPARGETRCRAGGPLREENGEMPWGREKWGARPACKEKGDGLCGWVSSPKTREREGE